jgi:PHD/YefM family antitoxin component YafN of YafNO toxin-antitoxin module
MEQVTILITKEEWESLSDERKEYIKKKLREHGIDLEFKQT